MDSEKEVLLTQEGYDNLENSVFDEAKNALAANETKIA